MYQALEQFHILNFSVGDFELRSYLIPLLIIFLFSIFLKYITDIKNNMVWSKNFAQIILRNLYLFVLDVLKQNVGIKGIVYFPIIFNIFFFYIFYKFKWISRV